MPLYAHLLGVCHRGVKKRFFTRCPLQNKEKALKILYSKLYDMKTKEQEDKIASTRKSQVGSGDRSEKIRTYNYPQSRITDHRINKTLFNLDSFLNMYVLTKKIYVSKAKSRGPAL